MIFDTLASLIFTFGDIIFFELLIAIVISVDEHGHIKWTLEEMFGDLSQYQRTSIVIIVLFFLIVFYWLFNQVFDSWIMQKLVNMQYRLIIFAISVVSFWVFWTAKVFFSREWKFHITLGSLIVFILSFVIWFVLTFYVKII